jgi:hypothetical protein
MLTDSANGFTRAFIVSSLPLRGALASLVVLAALMVGCSS